MCCSFFFFFFLKLYSYINHPIFGPLWAPQPFTLYTSQEIISGPFTICMPLREIFVTVFYQHFFFGTQNTQKKVIFVICKKKIKKCVNPYKCDLFTYERGANDQTAYVCISMYMLDERLQRRRSATTCLHAVCRAVDFSSRAIVALEQPSSLRPYGEDRTPCAKQSGRKSTIATDFFLLARVGVLHQSFKVNQDRTALLLSMCELFSPAKRKARVY